MTTFIYEIHGRELILSQEEIDDIYTKLLECGDEMNVWRKYDVSTKKSHIVLTEVRRIESELKAKLFESQGTIHKSTLIASTDSEILKTSEVLDNLVAQNNTTWTQYKNSFKK